MSHCAKIVFLQNFWDVKNEGFEKKKKKYIYIYIWLWARLPPQILPFLAFFPSLKGKNGEKEMLQICPISLFTFFVKLTQKGPGTAVPSIFEKTGHWDCSPSVLFFGSFGFQS